MNDSDGPNEKDLVYIAQESLILLAGSKLEAKNYSGALKLAALCQSLGTHVLALEIIKSCHDGPALKTNRHKSCEKEFQYDNFGLYMGFEGNSGNGLNAPDKDKEESGREYDASSGARQRSPSGLSAIPEKDLLRALRKKVLPENPTDLIEHILMCDDLFSMILVPYWEEPEIIEKKFKEVSVKIHPDRHQGSARSISAFAKLGSAFDDLKRNPIQYTMRLQIADVKAGIASEWDLPRPEEKIGYGKTLGWGNTNGFDNGKRSYTWGVGVGGGTKKHVNMNPAAEEGQQMNPEQLFAGGGDASNWLAPLSYNSGNAHRFDGSGVYQSFSNTGAAIARNGTRFDAKNN